MRYLAVFLISLAVTLGGLVAYQRFLLPKRVKKIYVVNTDTLMKIEKRDIVKAAKEGDKNAFQKALEIDKKFQEAINYIANRDNAIVLTKKAVISNNYDKDITNEILLMTGAIK